MDATEFRRRSQAVWEAMAPGWDSRHAYFEEIARPVTDLMLERVVPERGQTILDLAAGTGVAGFSAAGLVGREGHVIVSDFAAGMVDAAKRHAARLGLTNVECRVLDAERLDLPDDAADRVICRWGYMLMADPAAAFRETRRVLRPGGRLAMAVFTGPDENPWGSLPASVLVERGHMPPPEAGAPGLFALADRSRLSQLLADAGFSEPRFEEVAFTWRFADHDRPRPSRRRRATTRLPGDPSARRGVRRAERRRAAGSVARGVGDVVARPRVVGDYDVSLTSPIRWPCGSVKWPSSTSVSGTGCDWLPRAPNGEDGSSPISHGRRSTGLDAGRYGPTSDLVVPFAQAFAWPS